MKIDLSDTSQSKTLKKRALVVLILVTAMVVIFALQPKVPTVSSDELQTSTVVEGDLDLNIPVYGEYISRYERLLSAPSSSQVVEILVRAGTDVEPDTMIAKLHNPDLHQLHDQELAALERLQAEFSAFKLRQQTEQLALQAEIADIENQLQLATLNVDVNQRLANQGIAAKIELERAQLAKSQQQKRFDFAQFRSLKQKELHQFELTQQHIALQQQQKAVAVAAEKIAQRTVTAGIKGTLQRLDIELGQRVSQGQNLARVGSKDQLMARLQFPQRLAERLSLGSKVTVNHSQGALSAQVQQISSVIENGFIIAEAVFSQPLPSYLRPAQPLSARVFLARMDDAVYIKQIPGLMPLSGQTLYRLSSDQQQLEQVEVLFGELSGSNILIKSGLKPGDVLVANDFSHWHQHAQLKLSTL